MSKKIKLFIALSLCLNVLLAGALIGAQSKRFIPEHEGVNHEIVRAHMEDFRKQNKELHRQTIKERKIAMQMLKDGNSSKQEYMAQIEKINSLQGEMFTKISEAMFDAAQKLTPEEREKISGFMKLKHRRGSKQ